ncbi:MULTISPECIES: zinc-binding alcohol dehydrogenase family protein [Sphingobacterium]|nr:MULTISPECIES: zinc-binding alcohol dehydrogenase family protein [Sphingobacterium]APU98439.1 sorbitol dehydrogenase [Sphingobacterium sp. B29]TWI20719.1 threonine dehydrogenase-like Zn-dependent dehydrogenase [Sphingobacterium siyangense]
MKAIKIVKEGRVEIMDIPQPTVKDGHVLVKVDYVGFCGSDLNTFRGLNPLVNLPVIPGHEIGATVVELGTNVTTDLKVGTKVTVNPYSNCGVCTACKNNRPNACRYNETMGVQRDGAMTEYLVLPVEKIIAGGQLSSKELALVEPMSVGFHAVDRASVTDSDIVLVFGCGMIGVGAIIRSALRGATVIAVDVSTEKLELAKKLGAKYTINSATEDLLARLDVLTQSMGADVVIEAVGRKETYLAAIAAAAYTGRVLYIGYAKEAIPFDTQFFVKKELDISGSRNATAKDFAAVMNYLKMKTCPIEELITAIYRAEDAQLALESWLNDPGRVFRLLIAF